MKKTKQNKSLDITQLKFSGKLFVNESMCHENHQLTYIISSLNSSKASGPNSIPYRILSFLTGVFPSVPKTAKVVPVFKKDSKLDYSTYRPISLLSNIEKILEKLMYKRLYTFLNNNNIIYNL